MQTYRAGVRQVGRRLLSSYKRVWTRIGRPARNAASLAAAGVVVVVGGWASAPPPVPDLGPADSVASSTPAAAPTTQVLQASARVVNGGPPSGRPFRGRVAVGTPVTVALTADREEQVHLRGDYAQWADVPGPSGSAAITFFATKPGRAVLEVERTGQTVAEFIVTATGGPDALS